MEKNNIKAIMDTYKTDKKNELGCLNILKQFMG
jgi:hypothetical protein